MYISDNGSPLLEDKQWQYTVKIKWKVVFRSWKCFGSHWSGMHIHQLSSLEQHIGLPLPRKQNIWGKGNIPSIIGQVQLVTITQCSPRQRNISQSGWGRPCRLAHSHGTAELQSCLAHHIPRSSCTACLLHQSYLQPDGQNKLINMAPESCSYRVQMPIS